MMIIAVALTATGCSSDKTAAKYLARGQAYMSRKDYGRAALQFKNAVRLRPKDPQAEYQLALAYLAGGKLTDAVAALNKVTHLDPKNAEAQVKLAELMVRSRDLEVIRRGQKRAQDVLATAPDNVDAINALALSELELREPGEAERHLQEALAKLPTNLQSSVELATVYLTQGKLGAAEQVLKTTTKAHPTSVDASVALGELYTLMSQWNNAEKQFRNALQIDSKEPRALLGLARAQVRLGHLPEAEQTYEIISSLPDQKNRNLHATFLFSEGKRDLAIKEFERLVKEDAEDRETRSRLVSAYVVSGRVRDGDNLLNAALKKNPHDVDALLQRSLLLLSAGSRREAESDLHEVLHARPDSAQAHYLLAEIYSGSGQTERYRSELAKVLQYDSRMLAARAELARALTLAGSPKASLDLLASAPTAQQQTVPLIIQRNLAMLASGNRAAFRAGAEAGVKMARVPELLLQDAVVKLSDKDYSGARSLLQEVLSHNPEHVRALKTVALSFVAQNQPQAAARFLKDYAAQHPKSAAVQEFVGNWFWEAGDRTQAHSFYEASKVANPRYLAADLSLAAADLTQGKLTEAQATLDAAVASHDDNAMAHLLLGNVQEKAGNYVDAVAQYRKALALDPQNVIILNNLAYALVDAAHDPDAALFYAQKAVEVAPRNPDALGTLGWVFYHKGLYQNALEYLRKAVNGDRNGSQPNATIRQYHLATTYFKLNEPDLGRDALAKANHGDTNMPEVEMARAMALETAHQ